MILKRIKQFFEYAEADRINQASAQCSYYVVLSFIPFMILLLTLVQYLDIAPEQITEAISFALPVNLKSIIEEIIMEVYSKSIGTISISFVFTIFSAIQGLFAFTNEMQQINNYKRIIK